MNTLAFACDAMSIFVNIAWDTAPSQAPHFMRLLGNTRHWCPW